MNRIRSKPVRFLIFVMGCCWSENRESPLELSQSSGNKPLRRNIQWKSTETPFTLADLQAKRDVFWDTSPKYEGRIEIWQALKAACESEDDAFAQIVIDSAGIMIPTGLLSDGCYDELGAHYNVPEFCFSKPINLSKSSAITSTPEIAAESKGNDETSEAYTLKLRLSTNKDVTMQSPLKSNVSTLKQRLAENEHLAPDAKIRFICLGRILDDQIRNQPPQKSIYCRAVCLPLELDRGLPMDES